MMKQVAGVKVSPRYLMLGEPIWILIGETVSVVGEKIKNSWRAQAIINILKECAGSEMKSGMISSESLAKDMRTV